MSHIPELEHIETLLWDHLEDALRSRKSAFRQCYMASVNQGGIPDVRTMTLRGTSRQEGYVQFNTDERSPKVAQLRGDSSVSLLFYDGEKRVQIRMNGRVVFHHEDEVSRRVWEETRGFSRRAYLAPLPPGTPTEMPVPNFPTEFREHAPTTAESSPGFHNFIVMRCHVVEMDYYQVAAKYPFRAGFVRPHGSGPFSAQWRMP